MNGTAIGPVANTLLRQIEALVRIEASDREKPISIVEEVTASDWASVTFVGARHRLALRLEGDEDAVAEALATLVAALPEADVAIPGHFIAEMAAPPGGLTRDAGGVRRALVIEALVLRD